MEKLFVVSSEQIKSQPPTSMPTDALEPLDDAALAGVGGGSGVYSW